MPAILLLAVLLVCPSRAEAQKTIGVIMTGDIAYYQYIHKAFADRISGKGYKLVVQKPAPEPMAWTNAARKLVAIGSDVIVSYGAPATLTVMKETSSVPIIFAGVYDPESMGIAGKGNATGISSKVSVQEILKILKDASNFTTLGVIFDRTEKDTILQVREIKRLEGSMGFKTVLFDASKKQGVSNISNVNGLLMTTSCTAMCQAADIIQAAMNAKIPSAATIGGGQEKGIVFTLMANPQEQGTAVAEIVQKVLGGASPSSIAVQQPGKIDLIINKRMADDIGLTVPGGILSRATRVIE